MSLYDYRVSRDIVIQDYPYYALVMALMRQSDSINTIKLMNAFPEAYAELNARYDAPGGRLESDDA